MAQKQDLVETSFTIPTNVDSSQKEKTILNSSTTDPNKILPMKYKWARTHYKTGVANNWTP